MFQDYPWDYNLLSNVSLFLGNLTVALTFGLVFCIGMELPLAKLQKIIIGAYVTRMTKGQKWCQHMLVITEMITEIRVILVTHSASAVTDNIDLSPSAGWAGQSSGWLPPPR